MLFGVVPLAYRYRISASVALDLNDVKWLWLQAVAEDLQRQHGEQLCRRDYSWVGVKHIEHPTGCDKPCPLCFQRLHSGVLRDLERQNQKKENIRLLEEQIALTKQLMEERDKVLMDKGSQQS